MPYRGRGGSGGGSVTAEQLLLLEHLKYNRTTERIEADVAIATTLNTFWLSDQWGISSGGASLFFSSTDQGIDFSPIMQGMKNQAIPANRNESGIVHPFNRLYSKRLGTVSLKGTEATTGAVPYEGVSNLDANIGVFGVTATLAESLNLGDKLVYTIYKGTDNSGPIVFQQQIVTTDNRTDGFKFTGWWDKPAEEFSGTALYATIVVKPVDDEDNTRILLVRPTAEDANVHWNELQYRTFVDVQMPNNDTLRNGTMYDQDHHVITVDKMLAMTGMTEGDSVRVAHDPSVDAQGNVTSYIESSLYIFQGYHWQRVGTPDSIDRSNEFHVRDGDTYYVNHPTSDDGTSNTTITRLLYAGTSAGASHNSSFAMRAFTNDPDGTSTDDNDMWNGGWFGAAENSAPAARIHVSLGRTANLAAIEYQGHYNTGYTDGPYGVNDNPISGPRDVVLRFGTTKFSNAANSGVGDVANINHQWQNLDIGANTSSPNGLAEYLDLKAANGGNAITASHFAMDILNTWDSRNIAVRHILFHHEVPTGDKTIYVTLDDSVKGFTIHDGNGNFNVGSNTLVELGIDSISLERPGEFRFYRVNNGFKVYEGSDLVAEGST